ncbi:hypothetical protein MLD38_021314 [Melastoma candidum]|uniref:Uncharacterized protein n=1 Tax=Melastoma candidum TaxID=119954 RepID=A0ACB9QFR1_9MYRT|nr:hypothetical protein MLD38_021314 [Melastoma candidum]
MLKPPSDDPLKGEEPEPGSLDFTEVDIRLSMLVYISREKRPGYDHNKKAGAMNALIRASAIMSNGPFILNLDCDHYIYNSHALREGMCFMMDRGGERLCYIQFPQRFEGIDPSDRYWTLLTEGAETPPFFVQVSLEVNHWPEDGTQPDRIESRMNRLL